MRRQVSVAVVATATLFVFAACSNGAADPVKVTGTEVCTQLSSSSDGLTVSEVCEDQTSDPRVSGTASVTGEITSTGNHIIDAILVGTGEYEGLEYEVHWEGVDDPWTITGTIRDSE